MGWAAKRRAHEWERFDRHQKYGASPSMIRALRAGPPPPRHYSGIITIGRPQQLLGRASSQSHRLCSALALRSGPHRAAVDGHRWDDGLPTEDPTRQQRPPTPIERSAGGARKERHYSSNTSLAGRTRCSGIRRPVLPQKGRVDEPNPTAPRDPPHHRPIPSALDRVG